MDRTDIAYLLNSTPKYYYLLELHVALIRRYAPKCKWPIYFATEEPENPVCKILKDYSVTVIALERENSSFISSRKRALELLPDSIKYVLPMQEDFLLERSVDTNTIYESVNILDKESDIISIRYMPCPGPNEINSNYSRVWKYIKNDTYLFTFQATLWRRNECLQYYTAIKNEVDSRRFSSEEERNLYEVKMNIAENSSGQKIFATLFSNKKTLGYIRQHKYPNAVYLSPWPYRPTAVIKGVLQPFAKELAEREGFLL
jgi:hypothetical protein